MSVLTKSLELSRGVAVDFRFIELNAQRISKYGDGQNTSLTPDSCHDLRILCHHTQELQTLKKTLRFWPTLYSTLTVKHTHPVYALTARFV